MKALGISNTIVDSLASEVSMFGKNVSEVVLDEEQGSAKENALMLDNFRSYDQPPHPTPF